MGIANVNAVKVHLENGRVAHRRCVENCRRRVRRTFTSLVFFFFSVLFF